MQGYSDRRAEPPLMWIQGKQTQFPATEKNSTTTVWVPPLGSDTGSSKFPGPSVTQGSEKRRVGRRGKVPISSRIDSEGKAEDWGDAHKALCQAQCQLRPRHFLWPPPLCERTSPLPTQGPAPRSTSPQPAQWSSYRSPLAEP